MSEKEPKKQPKYDKRKEPDTNGGDGLEEQVTPDANFTRTKKSKEEEEEKEEKEKKEKSHNKENEK